MADQEQPEPIGWAIIELMGRHVIAGQVREESRFGIQMMRVDVPGADSLAISQIYGAAAIYCITPTTEEAARKALRNTYNLPELVRTALPAPRDADGEDIPF